VRSQSILVALPLLAVSPLLVDCEFGGGASSTESLFPSGTCVPATLPSSPAKGPTVHTFDKINHIVVIYMENHSFDNLYGADSLPPSKMSPSPGGNPQSNVCDGQKGMFPGIEGMTPMMTVAQVDQTGATYTTLPQPLNATTGAPDPMIPGNLKDGPFDLINFQSDMDKTPDLVHRWYQEPQQIDKGKMDKFAAISDSKGLSMGYYQTCQLPLAQIAKQYTLCDHFFHGAFGGSFLNHQWLVAAASPIFPSAPLAVTAQVDAKGNLIQDGFVTPNGCFAVNTSFTVNTPHPSTPASQLVPNQTNPTIGDRLSASNIDWAWYSGGWNDAINGHPGANFQFHHQAFAYFANYADGTPGRAAHLKDETDLDALLTTGGGMLKPVTFVKFYGDFNEHPGYSDVAQSEQHAVDLIDMIMKSPSWKDTAIIVTYDENGGQWDHMAPPTHATFPPADGWGPGTRVPAIVISPYAKKGTIDKTVYDTTAILATIEHRFDLQPLSSRDAAEPDMAAAFDFTQTPETP
jgi:phospholipase C